MASYFPDRANFLAVAATVALVAGAVLYGIFGRSIDEVPPLDIVSAAAIYAGEEHGICRNERATYQTESEAAAGLTEWIGAPVTVFDLSDLGYSFVGGAHCEMPVPARSAHLTYRKRPVPPDNRRPMISVYVVSKKATCGSDLCCDLQPGQWCSNLKAAAACRRTVLRATDGRVVYFLVCCDERDLDAVKNKIALTTPASK
jgi:hypothetical protein